MTQSQKEDIKSFISDFDKTVTVEELLEILEEEEI